jgi:hypothetical protein
MWEGVTCAVLRECMYSSITEANRGAITRAVKARLLARDNIVPNPRAQTAYACSEIKRWRLDSNLSPA